MGKVPQGEKSLSSLSMHSSLNKRHHHEHHFLAGFLLCQPWLLKYARSFLFFCRITFIILSLECILLSSVSQAWLTSDLVFPLSAHFEQRYMPSAPLMLAPGFPQHKICIFTCICYDIPMYICICMLILFSPLSSHILACSLCAFTVVSFARQLYPGCTFLYFLSPGKISSL